MNDPKVNNKQMALICNLQYQLFNIFSKFVNLSLLLNVPEVNFINILRAAFAPILLRQKIQSQTLTTVKLGYNELGYNEQIFQSQSRL